MVDSMFSEILILMGEMSPTQPLARDGPISGKRILQ